MVEMNATESTVKLTEMATEAQPEASDIEATVRQ